MLQQIAAGSQSPLASFCSGIGGSNLHRPRELEFSGQKIKEEKLYAAWTLEVSEGFSSSL